MHTVLITEDDDNLRDNLERILSLEGFRVLSAKNGLNAYKIILKQGPDLIISDIQMPYLDGFELLKLIISNPRTSSIPFIFLTAENDVQKLREGLSMGAKHYITKPFDLEFLLSTINSVIGNGKKGVSLNRISN